MENKARQWEPLQKLTYPASLLETAVRHRGKLVFDIPLSVSNVGTFSDIEENPKNESVFAPK